MSDFMLNEHGLWCASCGECVARGGLDDDNCEPDECRCCGYPDPESVAEYHLAETDGDICEGCGDSGWVERYDGGIWAGENIGVRLIPCDCACGDSVREEYESAAA